MEAVIDNHAAKSWSAPPRLCKKTMSHNACERGGKKVAVPKKSVVDECEFYGTTSKHRHAGEGIKSRFDLPLLHVSCCLPFFTSRNA